MNDKLQTSAQQIAALRRADEIGVAMGQNAGGVLPFSTLAMSLRPADQDQVLRAQKPIVALAFKGKSEARQAIDAALLEGKALHRQNKALQAENQAALQHAVGAEYARLVDGATEKLLAGHPAALGDLESEADLGTRFQAERDAVHNGLRKIGHAQIPLGVILRDAIDGALADLAAKLEKQDEADCKDFGLNPEYASRTVLVQNVRLQFYYRTRDVERFAALPACAACSPFLHSMFEDFLDLSDW